MLTKNEITELFKKRNNEILDKIDDFKDNFVIMPAGAKGQNLFDMLDVFNIKPKYFIDNSEKKQGSTYKGVKVISFDEYLKIDKRPTVVVSANLMFEPEIVKQIKSVDAEYIINNYEFIYSGDSYLRADKILIQIFDRYQNLRSLFSDDISRLILDDLLRYRLTINSEYTKKILNYSNVQYFEPDIYKISSNDSIADCGAYIGDTFEHVNKLLNGKIKNYYMFEPDENNFEKIKKYSSGNVEIYKKGCWSKETTLQFTNDGNSASKISDEGTIKIPVTSLDEQLKNKEVTFIKMDIEGAEIEALKGAKNIIQNQKPVLAICVYHKFMDLFDIPELIRSYGVDYKYYLRHYTMSDAETVLYAVPNN